ncbi:MAG: hypothetical protein AB7P01_03030 [Bacteroidia bacterium]
MIPVSIIRKDAYKRYLKNAIITGFVFGTLFFISGLQNKIRAWETSLWMGFAFGFGFALLGWSLGFFIEEYWKRKKKLENLQSFNSILENGFSIHEELYYEGTYDTYFTQIFWLEKYDDKGRNKLEYVNVCIYFDKTAEYDVNALIKDIISIKIIEKASFDNGVLTYLPLEHQLKNNIIESLPPVITLLKNHKLNPAERNVL